MALLCCSWCKEQVWIIVGAESNLGISSNENGGNVNVDINHFVKNVVLAGNFRPDRSRIEGGVDGISVLARGNILS